MMSKHKGIQVEEDGMNPCSCLFMIWRWTEAASGKRRRQNEKRGKEQAEDVKEQVSLLLWLLLSLLSLVFWELTAARAPSRVSLFDSLRLQMKRKPKKSLNLVLGFVVNVVFSSPLLSYNLFFPRKITTLVGNLDHEAVAGVSFSLHVTLPQTTSSPLMRTVSILFLTGTEMRKEGRKWEKKKKKPLLGLISMTCYLFLFSQSCLCCWYRDWRRSSLGFVFVVVSFDCLFSREFSLHLICSHENS